jgi:hypothetical protein
MNTSDNSININDIFENLPFSKDDVKQNQLLLELIAVTVDFRDDLKQTESYTLTIEDTRFALDALSAHLEGKKFKVNLTKYQKLLADKLIDTVLLIKLK